MIGRAARHLATSRQALPRPARLALYSTPSKPAKAPALATAAAPAADYPAFLDHPEPSTSSSTLSSFLRRPTSYTVLPNPQPIDKYSHSTNSWYTDSPTQELIAVIDACLHNLYDVPRAKQIFGRLRKNASTSVFQSQVYDSFLEAYVAMASGKDMENRSYWLSEAWSLYEIMETGSESVIPTSSTYAIMLIAWLRFHPDSPDPVQCSTTQTPLSLLSHLVDREISAPSVVADRIFSSPVLYPDTATSASEASQVIKLLSKAAVDLNLSRVVNELGKAEAIGESSYEDPRDGVPEVMPVTVSKPNKSSDDPSSATPEIPFNLFTLRKHLAQVALARRVLPAELTARQKLLEESVYDVAIARLKHQTTKLSELGLTNGALQAPDLQKWMWEWHCKLQHRLTDAIRDIEKAEQEEAELKARVVQRKNAIQVMPLAPFLNLVKPEKLSLITILEIMRLQGTGGVSDGMKTARALLGVGKSVEFEYKAQMGRKGVAVGMGVVPSAPLAAVRNPSAGTSGGVDVGESVGCGTRVEEGGLPVPGHIFTKAGYGSLKVRRTVARKYIEAGEGWTADWTQAMRVKVGSILVECLMDVAEVERTAEGADGETISENQPAFFHSYEYLRGQKLGVIRLNPVVAERLAKDGLRETLHPRHLPMLVKPKPWLSHDQGGYLYNRVHAMRYKDSVEQLAYLKHASQLGNVELVYAGLDVLGSTPWKINRPVFNVVLAVWNSGVRLGKMPPAVYDDPEPEKPENYDVDLKTRNVYLMRQKMWMQGKAGNHSERCGVNYKIEIARAFLGDTIYFPHNLDFRGRAYPIPPHLSHIGDDLSRGLLMFAEAKPLGERGLRWLKIHLANLYGYDKANFDEREQFVMEHIEEVFDSATKPLEGRQWWTKADDPWQCLATCIELHAALTSPNPHEYISALPVHQDGTCNGLQHYAALGGDDRGAQQVNLSAAERPSDVYTYVGNMVEQMLEEDAKRGDRFALMLRGKISRKVVKQTVMTTVYGVTFVGAREQIERQLKERKDIPSEDCWQAAAYLAKKTLTAIGDLFTGAKAIQTWLNLSARLISKSIPAERLPEAMAEHSSRTKPGPSSAKRTAAANRHYPERILRKEQMTSVVWTTPLGLPIVQPYRKPKRKQITTSLQTVYIGDPNSPAEVNSLKQASAFPPNFIHSLDATHMMLTALECRTQGLTFASVHDSYWTHACSIDKMSEIIRDTFISLHSSDVLGRLQQEFKERYKGYKVPLVNLRQGKLLRHLKLAGSKIVASPEQARTLGALAELVTVSETETSTVEETETSKAIANLREKLSDGVDLVKAKETSLALEPATHKQDLVGLLLNEDSESMETDEGLDEDDDEDRPRGAKSRKKQEEDDEVMMTLLGRFIDLTSILPPLPEKGSFNVQAIKKSQYFFS